MSSYRWLTSSITLPTWSLIWNQISWKMVSFSTKDISTEGRLSTKITKFCYRWNIILILNIFQNSSKTSKKYGGSTKRLWSQLRGCSKYAWKNDSMNSQFFELWHKTKRDALWFLLVHKGIVGLATPKCVSLWPIERPWNIKL